MHAVCSSESSSSFLLRREDAVSITTASSCSVEITFALCAIQLASELLVVRQCPRCTWLSHRSSPATSYVP
eukprot:6180473-Pleurochrysis_carterae.AAC.1